METGQHKIVVVTTFSCTEKERDSADKAPYILNLGMGTMMNGSNSFTFRPWRARCPVDSNPEGQHDSRQKHRGEAKLQFIKNQDLK
jgi:hypothetical protein